MRLTLGPFYFKPVISKPNSNLLPLPKTSSQSENVFFLNPPRVTVERRVANNTAGAEEMIAFRLLNRNPIQRTIPLHPITQTQLPFLPPNPLISTGVASHFASFYFFSSAASKPRKEFPEIEQPILDFFHSYGFNDSQIKKCVHKCPSVLSIERIKPKLEHLLAFGFSTSELVRLIGFYPNLLATSLKNRIEPNLSLLEATVGSRKHIIKAITQGQWLLTHNIEKEVIPNLKILRETNIPIDKVIRLFTRYPRILYKHPDVITGTINKLKGLGMNPSSSAFIHAMNALCALKKETWERKMELYKTLGWSEKDTLLAFSRQPMCMQLSDDKIKKKMAFFNEKLGWDSSMVVGQPVVLTYSLEKRIIPRCALLSLLAKNGLWNRKLKAHLFILGEKTFVERFVDRYKKEVPEVIDAYQGKIAFVGFQSMEAESDKS